mmetsp:Transcript_16882/g.55227  ORF Transcript_16882/g.55227 Transcript_16882/m.55227 type:complete len:243 (-) Transcript_16882:550-1278(-)
MHVSWIDERRLYFLFLGGFGTGLEVSSAAGSASASGGAASRTCTAFCACAATLRTSSLSAASRSASAASAALNSRPLAPASAAAVRSLRASAVRPASVSACARTTSAPARASSDSRSAASAAAAAEEPFLALKKTRARLRRACARSGVFLGSSRAASAIHAHATFVEPERKARIPSSRHRRASDAASPDDEPKSCVTAATLHRSNPSTSEPSSNVTSTVLSSSYVTNAGEARRILSVNACRE